LIQGHKMLKIYLESRTEVTLNKKLCLRKMFDLIMIDFTANFQYRVRYTLKASIINDDNFLALKNFQNDFFFAGNNKQHISDRPPSQ
jgi:hypothetical protein